MLTLFHLHSDSELVLFGKIAQRMTAIEICQFFYNYTHFIKLISGYNFSDFENKFLYHPSFLYEQSRALNILAPTSNMISIHAFG